MDRPGSTVEQTKPDQTNERGLVEGMWQLGLGESETTSYPVRPGDPDCIYFLRTGFCGYGDRCRFNHPPHRSTSPVAGAEVRMGGGDYLEQSRQQNCQHYMRTGSCKFGSSCKYNHVRQGAAPAGSVGLNIYGYPMRPGKECSYYMKMGHCKFGLMCKFHHPQPANVPMPTAVPPAAALAVYPIPSPAPQPYGIISGDWPVVRPSMMPGSFFRGPYGPILLSPGVVPFPGWAPYPASNPGTPPTNPLTTGATQLYGLTQLSPSALPYTGAYQALPYVSPSSCLLKEHSFPQRSGQPECQYYLKTGECKFASSCKYHHPAEWVAPESSSALSPMGLPLRPGTPTCSYYATHGICKYGPACKFDHPMGRTLSYSPSASSLSDMPIAPYPVGSSLGTLAAASSSSDLRAELILGLNKDSSPTMTLSLSISSSSSGSVSSRIGSISQSGTKTSDLGDAPS